MRRRGLLVGAWTLVTLAATLVAWAAVREVTAEVSPSQALPFPSAVALAEAPSDAPPPPSDPPDEAPARPAESPPADAPDEADVQAPAEQAPAEQAPAEQPPAEPDAVTRAYNLTGGVVTVRYRGATATLVSATPNSGFGVEVRDGGPDKVDVRFRADHHESRLVTRVRGGVPDPQREERPR